MNNGSIEEFDGISLVEWTKDNKIKSLKEFGCNLNNYNPYEHSDLPEFRDERASWFLILGINSVHFIGKHLGRTGKVACPSFSYRSCSCRLVRLCICSGWSARSAISTHLRIF